MSINAEQFQTSPKEPCNYKKKVRVTALNFQDSNSSTGFWHIRKFYNRNIANDWHKNAELKSQITESIDGKLHPKWCSSLYQILHISILKTNPFISATGKVTCWSVCLEVQRSRTRWICKTALMRRLYDSEREHACTQSCSSHECWLACSLSLSSNYMSLLELMICGARKHNKKIY